MVVVELGKFYSRQIFNWSHVLKPLMNGSRDVINISASCRPYLTFASVRTISVPNTRTFFTSSCCEQRPRHFKEFKEVAKHTIPEKEKTYILPHPIWTDDDVHNVQITHRKPESKIDKAAYYCVQALRLSFDTVSLYKVGTMTENKWLNRIIMLETIAGVPGMIGGMARHLKSLRRLYRDHGWIHTLLEEAENERMHLMTALELKKPGVLFRGLILTAQGVFVNVFFIAYLFSPQFCHRFVGYLEEEAVKTYTYCLECIENDKLPTWKYLPAPEIATNYWKLKEGATMKDAILAIRADEAHHRVVNHTLSSIHLDEQNPFHPGQRKL